MQIDASSLSKPSMAFSSLLGGSSEAKGTTEISVDELIPYEDQPFKSYTEEALLELAEDIETNGIISPVIVRPFNGKYQILAGHNRTNAAKLAGLDKVPCIIKDVDDDTACLIMTNTNLFQRQKLLPSEKAFAYKVQTEALKNKKVADAGTETAKQNNESRTNVFRYIRLTFLNKDLLDMVDNDMIPFRAGVNISYLSSESQELLIDIINEYELQTISLKQSEKIRETADNGNISEYELKEIILKKSKTEKKKKIKINWSLISDFFEDDVTNDDIENTVFNALTAYFKNNN